MVLWSIDYDAGLFRHDNIVHHAINYGDLCGTSLPSHPKGISRARAVSFSFLPDWVPGPTPKIPLDSGAAKRQADAEEILENTAVGESPSLHGRTKNDEVCKCMPGTLEAPTDTFVLSKAKDKSREDSAAAMMESHKDLRKAGEKMNEPKVDAFEQSLKAYDVALAALQKRSEALEGAAQELKQSFDEVKEAHSESNCTQVAKDAAEDQLEPPKCDEQWKETNKVMRQRKLLAKPTCDFGAASLESLRESGAPLTLGVLAPVPRLREASCQQTKLLGRQRCWQGRASVGHFL